ncbi:response regulator transcription factor [Vibrio vulnificus]|uniref:response regulator transcription factor n=1 Tax=Vibrio vulnificus TaxID=672 RepID=UPI001CCB8958|nr:response regulator transcription factor [Vibrio vulnificus]MCA0761748.1 response regulator transcription factor [Vibrio vulnificus]
MQKADILIVEDDKRVAKLMSEFLEINQYSCIQAYSGNEALDLCKRFEFKLLILDFILPDTDGIKLSKILPCEGKVPKLMVTSIDNEMQEILALDSGIDDYITKPIKPHKLLSRVKALIRRSSHTESIDNKKILRIEPTYGCISLNGTIIELSDAEFELFCALYSKPNQKVSRDELILALRGFEYDGTDRSIDMRVSSLRRKIQDSEPPYRVIKTIRGFGYMFISHQ